MVILFSKVTFENFCLCKAGFANQQSSLGEVAPCFSVSQRPWGGGGKRSRPPPPVVPDPESLVAQAAYTEALESGSSPGSGLGPNCFQTLRFSSDSSDR